MPPKRHLVSLSDLSTAEILNLLELAERMAAAIGLDDDKARDQAHPLDRILATLFYEPSTRTRLSFELAVLRLGGQALGFADPASSSAAKGETLADTARMVSAYADLIVIRHPLAGAAKVVANFATVPVVNAGDGAREHPTQTLTDLFCIRRELGTLEGLEGRALRRPEVWAHGALTGSGHGPVGLRHHRHRARGIGHARRVHRRVRAAGGTYTATASLEEAIGDLDVLYMTRVQRERFPSAEEYERVKGVYVLTPETMQRGKEALRVLHPLPRVDEIAPGVDADPRAAYFRQAAGGVPVRMALLALLLHLPCSKDASGAAGFGKPHRPAIQPLGEPPAPEPTASGPPCQNPKCITSTEPNLAAEWYEREAGDGVRVLRETGRPRSDPLGGEAHAN